MRSRAPGLALRAWLAATAILQPALPAHLRRRLKRGKEDPDRWREKLGEASIARPPGRLVWLHAVGLGEVLALRGLIVGLAKREPDLNFLVTSATRASASAFSKNLPPRTIHQFAPLDAPGPASRFLAHWRPDMSIWAEQELWPGLVLRTKQAGIPVAVVNARMNADAYARRRRARVLYRDVLSRVALVSAQDERTARHLEALGARDVSIHGSLKPAAPPLADGVNERAALESAIEGRLVWLVAPSHPADEALAFAAHRTLLRHSPEALLVVVPRFPNRAASILSAARAEGLTVAQRSVGAYPKAGVQAYLADTFGELGLFYRLAPIAFIGGSLSNVEGHNPWEAIQLGCAVLHGPRTANFAADYNELDSCGAARTVYSPDDLFEALVEADATDMAGRARLVVDAHVDRVEQLCQELLELL